MAEGDPGPDTEDENEAQGKEGRPEDPVGDPSGVEMPEARVDERKDPRRFADPLPPDLPQQTVALAKPAGAVPTPILLARAQDLAEDAILVSGSKEVFRTEKFHDRIIFHSAGGKSNCSYGMPSCARPP